MTRAVDLCTKRMASPNDVEVRAGASSPRRRTRVCALGRVEWESRVDLGRGVLRVPGRRVGSRERFGPSPREPSGSGGVGELPRPHDVGRVPGVSGLEVSTFAAVNVSRETWPGRTVMSSDLAGAHSGVREGGASGIAARR